MLKVYNESDRWPRLDFQEDWPLEYQPASCQNIPDKRDMEFLISFDKYSIIFELAIECVLTLINKKLLSMMD